MKNIVFNRKPIASILAVMLVMCALPGISYGSDDISVAASTDSPLTEATLHESVVTPPSAEGRMHVSLTSGMR